MSDLIKKYRNHIHVLNGNIMLNIGPMHLRIIARKDSKPLTRAAIDGAKLAIKLLDEVSRYRNALKHSASDIGNYSIFPEVVQRMISACLLTKDRALTPMSAVAGAISDMVAENIEKKGSTKVVVENGGDIAIKLHNDEVGRIGIVPRVGETEYAHVINVNAESKIGGIATSGFGGLGFTKGVASAAVALSPNGALADACGTILGNSTIVESAKVIYRFAEELDPNTDIKGQKVTFAVDRLTHKEVSICIQNGLKKAEELMKMDVVIGAVIFVQGEVGMIPKNIATPVGLNIINKITL